MSIEPTLKTLDNLARDIGVIRARGTYNNGPYWNYKDGRVGIITRDRLLSLLGY